MSEALVNALKGLDPTNDAQWTQDGLPALAVLKETTGELISRDDIKLAWPGFSRTNMGPTEVPVETDAPFIPQVEDVSSIVVNAIIVPENPDLNGDGEIDPVEFARDEYAKAQVIMSEATAYVKSKRDALDSAITKAAAGGSVSTADTIKAYQLSQANQRAKAASQNKAIIDLIAANKEG
jgi:hypothetical protein